MRASTVLSLFIAVILAGLAVFAARTWLNVERTELMRQAAQSASSEEVAPQNMIVIAKSQLQFGERLTKDKLELIPWASDALPPGAFSEIDVLVSENDEEARWVVATIAKGEPVFESRITDPGQRAKLSTALTPGMKAISIRVNDVLGVAGFVLPGDRVDVMLTRKAGGRAVVDILLQGVKVLAIDQIADDRKDKPSVVRTVTFEVSTEEAQKLALGANVGTLSLALRNIASPQVEDARRITIEDLGVPDVSDELIAEVATTGPADTDEEIQRQKALEEMLQGFMTDISDRLVDVESSIKEQATVAEPVQVKPVAAPEPEPKSSISRVTVTRDGQSKEYRVLDVSVYP